MSNDRQAPVVVNFADLVLPSGKTIRQENMELQHTIPLYTLVELDYDNYAKYGGLRLFVAYHGRDCDGTPLYYLTHTADCIGYKPGRPGDDASEEDRMRYMFRRGAYRGGFGEHSLTIIRSGKEVLDGMLEEWTDRDGTIRQGVIGIAETGWYFPE